jgi:aminopeptidase YwaD
MRGAVKGWVYRERREDCAALQKGPRMARTVRLALRSCAVALALALAPALPATVSAAAPLAFSRSNAQAHVRALCAGGLRVEGSTAEHRAFDYISAQLKSSGYLVTIQDVKLPKGKLTHNLVAEKKGRSAKVIVLGAHVDTKSPSPGANDNGSGVATLLELARDLKRAETQPTVRFVFFGGEEMSDKNPDHHHYGSRAYVRSLSRSQRSRIAGMVSVDMVGYGSVFNVRSMKVGPRTVVKSLQLSASRQKLKMPFLADPSRFGWSDHEPFERASIPAAWLEWRNDTTCHTRKDTPSHVNGKRLATSGAFVSKWVSQMSAAELTSLRP